MAQETTKKKAVAAEAVTIDANKIAMIASKAAAEAVGAILTGTIRRQTDMMAGLLTRMDALEIKSDGSTMTPTMTTKDETAEAEAVAASLEDEEVTARGHDDEGDDEEEEDGDSCDEDDMESASLASEIDKGDLEEMGDGPDDDNDKPGAFNKGAKNKGDQTTVEDKLGPNVNKSILSARFNALMAETKALASRLNRVEANNRQLQAENRKLTQKVVKANSTVERVNAQVERHASEVARRSISPELTGLLQKGGLDPVQMTASSAKITASELDAILSAARVDLDTQTRIRLKSEAARAGLMDEGRVERNYR